MSADGEVKAVARKTLIADVVYPYFGVDLKEVYILSEGP